MQLLGRRSRCSRFVVRLIPAIVPMWVCVAPSVAVAQTGSASSAESTGPGPEASNSTLGEVVVTAQRRTENLQEVPIAIVALSSDSLARMGVQSISQLSVAVPGLMMTEQHGGLAPFLRGVGTVASTAAEEGSVPVYVDGVLIPNLTGAAFSFPNVDRVEVLKGPQGTLFGRNSMGGLINVITRDPSHDTSGTVSVSYGNFATATASAYGTAGISDHVAMDLTVYTRQQGEGWGRNLNYSFDGPVRGTRQDSQYLDETLARSKLLYTPTDDLRIILTADYDNTRSTVGLERALLPGAKGVLGGVKQGSWWDSQSLPPSDPRQETWGGGARIEYNLNFAKLTSTTSFRREQQRFWFDQDGQAISYVNAPEVQKQHAWQQEFLLANSGRRFDWTAGLYYFYTNSFYDTDITSSIVAPINVAVTTTQLTRSYAGFGQGTYRFDTGTSVTAGFRFTQDKRQIDALETSLPGYPAGAGVVLVNRRYATDPTATLNAGRPTWRISIDQKLGDDMLAYASYNRGFKSGIFSQTGTAINQPAVRPEKLDAYEVGLKSELADRTIRLNVSAFLYEHTNTQLTKSISGAVVNFNAPGSENYGVDGELTFAPRIETGSLQIRADGSYQHGRYKDFPDAPISIPLAAGGNTFIAGDARGNVTIRTPTFSGSISTDYQLPTALGEFDISASYYRTAKFYWDVDNRLAEPSYGIANAALAWVPKGSAWRFSVFGQNLSNSQYSVYTTAGGVGDEYAPGPPRAFGVTAKLTF